ncbi:hypothetical protein [Kineococcus sp. SYSU DK003]|uniref:hypothetical protein n=1 Tax=Kineococcus sp. SYSU DK003 TaxID=3383124 RepID=UPI003D7EA61D
MSFLARLKDQLHASSEADDDPRPLAHGSFPGDQAVLIDLLLYPDTFVVATVAAAVLRYRDPAAVGLILEALSDPRCDDELEDWLLDAFLGTYVDTDWNFEPLRQMAMQACAQSPQTRTIGRSLTRFSGHRPEAMMSPRKESFDAPTPPAGVPSARRGAGAAA